MCVRPSQEAKLARSIMWMAVFVAIFIVIIAVLSIWFEIYLLLGIPIFFLTVFAMLLNGWEAKETWRIEDE